MTEAQDHSQGLEGAEESVDDDDAGTTSVAGPWEAERHTKSSKVTYQRALTVDWCAR